MNSYLNEVYRQTADGGYFDFARCQRADGTFYGTGGRCVLGQQVGARVDEPGKGRGGFSKEEGDTIKTAMARSLKSGLKKAELVKIADEVRAETGKKQIRQEHLDILVRKINERLGGGKGDKAAGANDGRDTRDLASAVSPQVKKKSEKWDAKIKADAAAKKAAEEAKTAPKEKKVGRSTKDIMDRQILRGEVKLDAKALANNPTYHGTTQETLSTLKTSYKMMQSMMKDPAFNTPANRARVINTRIAIWRTQKAIRESSSVAKLDPKSYEKDLKNSPKYDKTPGSTKPIAKAKTEDLPKLEKRMRDLSVLLSDPSLSKEQAIKVSDEMLDLNRRMMVARGDSKPASPNLKKIYQEQGFNAKPELVGTANDLTKRKDLLTNMDGTNVILYRGVTTQEFSDQFKGIGPGGDIHFAGRGIFGNGSYAGAASFENPGGTFEAGKNVAAAYAGERKDLASKVTAFGLRSDANVATFRGESYNERSRAYDEWFDRTLKEAEQKTGYKFNDVGEAAAALGIHAYQVPQRDGDYYVVLNRGAVVAAMDSQLSNDTGL